MPSFLGLDILSESPSVVRNADMIPNFRQSCKRENKKNNFFSRRPVAASAACVASERAPAEEVSLWEHFARPPVAADML